jgi:molybdopterin-containing oxidoreductase family iron-sulfur binding subunit
VSSLIQLTLPNDGDSKSKRPQADRSARKTGVDVGALREKLANTQGPQFWRSLEELADTEEFRQLVEDEFPDRTPDWNDPPQRRTFLKVMAASLGLAGLAACTKQPSETIVPYVRQPEQLVPGRPLYYATARPMAGGAIGVLAESHEGRPTKLEGNPTHPFSVGAIDLHTQASILNFYDPDRANVVTRKGNISSWVNFAAALIGMRDDHATRQGAGLRLLTAPIYSPTLVSQLQSFLTSMPQVRWHQWEPMLGIPGYNPQYNFRNAEVIVSLDSDFLAFAPAALRNAREFAAKKRLLVAQTPAEQKRALKRSPEEDQPEGKSNLNYAREAVPAKTDTNRLYVVEGTPSVTAGMADHRIRVKTSEVGLFAAQLAQAVGANPGAVPAGNLPEKAARVIPAIARDLQAHRGACLVIAGDYQPAGVHAVAHAINEALGNVGHTVTYAAPVEHQPVDKLASIRQLVDDINAGQVQTLIMIGVNPVYDAPADLQFEAALKKVKNRVLLSEFRDETGVLCDWHVPQAHYLESWSDTRAHDGTATIIQPLIAPLYGGVTAHQLFSVLNGKADQAPHDVVKEYWAGQMGGANFDAAWERALNDGVVPNTAAATSTSSGLPAGAPLPQPTPPGTMEIVFRPDPGVWYGEFSNNGWCQELPKPQNKMTWDNAVWISPDTAQRLGLKTEDLVEIDHRGLKVEAPVWVLPGHADDSITVQFGYGRSHLGRVANGIGYNAYVLRTSDSPWFSTGVTIRKTGGSYSFATSQHTQTMESRSPVLIEQYPEYLKHPALDLEPVPEDQTLFAEWAYTGYKWGMTIDLNACVGCHACTIACYAENNIPVVGKDQVSRNRIMHWIRVDRYYSGDFSDPELYYQPVPCMQCELAPCELVCPVAATVHSGDGLNQMVYNRCVGTRYCSNNCPYKVRRFNFYLYSDWYTPSLYGLRNPDVTVRSRGVMEKCTYCVQRINAAKIESEKEDRRIMDGEITPACAQACPAEAIIFGDINDPNSRVAKLKAQPRNYSLLEDLNTRPRTTYLARVKNPNPEIQKG